MGMISEDVIRGAMDLNAAFCLVFNFFVFLSKEMNPIFLKEKKCFHVQNNFECITTFFPKHSIHKLKLPELNFPAIRVMKNCIDCTFIKSISG
jgi:hypothetical protein